jgi:hypothetical protein
VSLDVGRHLLDGQEHDQHRQDHGGDHDRQDVGHPYRGDDAVQREHQIQQGDRGDRATSLLGIQKQWELAPGLRVLVAGESASEESDQGDREHRTIATEVNYSHDGGLQARTRNEFRWDEGLQERTQLLSVTQVEYKMNPAFTLLGRFRYSKTEDETNDTTQARIDERMLGVAYRPVVNDRFNALARYTHLSEIDPGTGTRSLAPETSMDVFSLDSTLQINPRLEWTQKLAARAQEDQLAALPTVETEMVLVVQRLTYNLYKPIDIGIEYRVLDAREADNSRRGWLTEVSWRLRRYVRLGVGYNFTDFSDNEFSQNDYSVHGWYFRIQGLY